MTEWFNGTPDIKRQPLRPVKERWMCPVPDCGGEMVFAGVSWSCNPPGNHHACTMCKNHLAISGKTYPRVAYLDEVEP